jgi:deoxyribonuclease-4
LGVCFDTCHAFAAGYDLREATAYRTTMDLMDRVVGLGRILFFHLNDSKGDLGDRKDRHEHIGAGCIGLEGFRLLVNDPRFQSLPMVLETPKGKKLKEDVRNIETLRSLLGIEEEIRPD